MSLKKSHEKLQILKNTGSTNTKIELLTDYLKDDEFREVVCLIYDASKHYKVNKLSKQASFTRGLLDPPASQNTPLLFAFLNKLANQKGTSNAQKEELATLASVDDETYEVVNCIINKDAKCGFKGKTINKAWEDLIFLMPYCRCSTEKKMGNIDYGLRAIGQEKADGMFVNIIIDKKGEILLRARSGNIIHQLDHLNTFFVKTPKAYQNTVYMGELLIMVNGKILPRKTGNGILSSCLTNTADPNLARQAIIKLWDAVPFDQFWNGYSPIAYKYRLGRASGFTRVMNNSVYLSMIQSKSLNSLEAAEDFYRALRKQGKEGAIVKNIHAHWKDTTSTEQIKMKNVMDAELRILSWNYGKKGTQFEGQLGSINCGSDDGLIKVSMSGFSNKERLEDWDERVGKIVGLEAESLITDKNRPGIYSLYLPRYVEMRPDRTATDSLKDLKER